MLTQEQALYELIYDRLNLCLRQLHKFADLSDFEEIVGNAARDLVNERFCLSTEDFNKYVLKGQIRDTIFDDDIR